VNTATPQPPYHDITAAILAGGRGARLGGVDKGLEELAGRPLVAHIIAALEPQCDTLLINANRNQPRYATFGYPVAADDNDEYPGPLAGMLSALRAARTRYVLCVPCDAPLLPADLTARLWRALTDNQARASVARSADGLQPVYVLLDRSLADHLHTYLDSGARKTADWLRAVAAAEADFSDSPAMFLNMNTDTDRAALLRKMQAASPW
jgi:molybdopterin-guanine dinucleotide biosynthesis protein A